MFVTVDEVYEVNETIWIVIVELSIWSRMMELFMRDRKRSVAKADEIV